MRKVIVMHNFQEEALDRLSSRFPQMRFLPMSKPYDSSQMADAEVLFGWGGRGMLTSAKNLKWLHSMSAGVDSFLGEVDELFGNDLLVSNSAGIYGVPISEHLLALMLALSHQIGGSVLNMPTGHWGNVPHCRELTGSTVAIVGYGDIGSHLAALLRPFHCTVLGFKRSPVEKPDGVDEMLYGDDGLEDLMARADYVCICLPGTEKTRSLIDRRRIALMKPTAALINIGRGYIVDTEALTEALATGQIAGAGLDVTEPEPLPQAHPLWSLPNTIITPHISGYTSPQWEERQMEFFSRNLEAYLAGLPLPGAVDRVHRY